MNVGRFYLIKGRENGFVYITYIYTSTLQVSVFDGMSKKDWVVPWLEKMRVFALVKVANYVFHSPFVYDRISFDDEKFSRRMFYLDATYAVKETGTHRSCKVVRGKNSHVTGHVEKLKICFTSRPRFRKEWRFVEDYQFV